MVSVGWFLRKSTLFPFFYGIFSKYIDILQRPRDLKSLSTFRKKKKNQIHILSVFSDPPFRSLGLWVSVNFQPDVFFGFCAQKKRPLLYVSGSPCFSNGRKTSCKIASFSLKLETKSFKEDPVVRAYNKEAHQYPHELASMSWRTVLFDSNWTLFPGKPRKRCKRFSNFRIALLEVHQSCRRRQEFLF